MKVNSILLRAFCKQLFRQVLIKILWWIALSSVAISYVLVILKINREGLNFS